MLRYFAFALLAVLAAAACGTPVNEDGSSSSGGTTSGAATGSTTAGSSGTGSASSSIGTTSTTGSSVGSASSSSTSGTSGSGSSTGTTTGGADAGFTVAPHASFPQMPDNGGPTVATVDVVTISFPGNLFDLSADVDALLASSWFPIVSADYGIQPGRRLASYTFPDAGPATAAEADTEAFLAQLIDAGAVPLSTANTIYAIQYPPGTQVTQGGGLGCQQLGGYHDSFLLWDGSPVYFAVIPDCSAAQAANFGYSEPAIFGEAVVSHELMEAATDPEPSTNAGWQFSAANPAFASYVAWLVSGSSEIGDLCVQEPPVQIDDGGFWAERMWSNTAALAAQGSPCIPVPAGELYYNVSTAATLLTAQADLASPQTLTVQLTGWSNAAMGDWEVGVQSITSAAQGSFDATPTLAGAVQGYVPLNNGQTATLTLTVPAFTPSQTYGAVLIYSLTQASYPDYNSLPLMVLVQ